MAILDAQARFADAQALTASGASTNVIDLGVTSSRLGDGEPMAVLIHLDATADDANADETYSAQLEMDSADSFGSPANLGGAQSIPRGTVAGSVFVLPIPVATDVERYVRLFLTLGGTTPSISISAYLVPQSFIDKRKDYPIGYTVS